MRRFLFSIMLGLALAATSVATFAEPVDFELEDTQGVKHKLSDYRGKWVVVNYWATWCPPCLTELPELVDFHEERKDKDAVVLGINFETVGIKKLRQFTEEYFISFPVLRSTPGPSGELGDIPGLPTTYLVSPEGEVIARQVGAVTAKLLTDFIASQVSAENSVDATHANEGNEPGQ